MNYKELFKFSLKVSLSVYLMIFFGCVITACLFYFFNIELKNIDKYINQSISTYFKFFSITFLGLLSFVFTSYLILEKIDL